MSLFSLTSDFQPSGDQPDAIRQRAEGVEALVPRPNADEPEADRRLARLLLGRRGLSVPQRREVHRREIQKYSGRQFDPIVVETFLSISEAVWQTLRNEIDAKGSSIRK